MIILASQNHLFQFCQFCQYQALNASSEKFENLKLGLIVISEFQYWYEIKKK